MKNSPSKSISPNVDHSYLFCNAKNIAKNIVARGHWTGRSGISSTPGDDSQFQLRRDELQTFWFVGRRYAVRRYSQRSVLYDLKHLACAPLPDCTPISVLVAVTVAVTIFQSKIRTLPITRPARVYRSGAILNVEHDAGGTWYGRQKASRPRGSELHR